MTEANPHLLIVDDDKEIRELLQQFLQQHGYDVSVAEDGIAMREQLQKQSMDLIIMDLMLPGEDGLELCKFIQNADSSIPVVMLTALGDETDRIVGLELGADDYIAKPFNPRELLARIKAVLRRVQRSKSEWLSGDCLRYEFSDWMLDVNKRELHGDGSSQSLSGGEFDLLMEFLSKPKQVLSREQLLDATRGIDANPFDRSIDIQISRLRKKIGDQARQAKMIQTVRNGGYILNSDVKRVTS